MRVERIGSATLYLGDCREIIPQIPKVSAVVTDPPYGINGGSGTVGKLRAHKHDYLSFEDTPDNIANIVVPAFRAALDRADGRGVITPGPKCLTFYPAPDAFGCLHQPATCSLNLWGRAQSQPIFYYGRPPRIGKTIMDTTYRIDDPKSIGGEDHPCPKPTKTMVQLVHLATEDGESVLDPFMGSGTTGVACANLGRPFYGIEIEPRYFEIACERIAAAHSQQRLFA